MTKAEARQEGINAKSKKARVLPEGSQTAKEILEKYGRVGHQLLHRLPPEKLQDARKAQAFNEALMAALRFGA